MDRGAKQAAILGLLQENPGSIAGMVGLGKAGADPDAAWAQKVLYMQRVNDYLKAMGMPLRDFRVRQEMPSGLIGGGAW